MSLGMQMIEKFGPPTILKRRGGRGKGTKEDRLGSFGERGGGNRERG